MAQAFYQPSQITPLWTFARVAGRREDTAVPRVRIIGPTTGGCRGPAELEGRQTYNLKNQTCEAKHEVSP